LRACTEFEKTGGSLLEKNLLIYCLMNGFFVAIAFKGIRRCVQAAKQRAVWLLLDCVSGKYLWALPKPTTFEKVDQTFNFGTESLAFILLCCPNESALKYLPPTTQKIARLLQQAVIGRILFYTKFKIIF
jgi:hypothetical protein